MFISIVWQRTKPRLYMTRRLVTASSVVRCLTQAGMKLSKPPIQPTPMIPPQHRGLAIVSCALAVIMAWPARWDLGVGQAAPDGDMTVERSKRTARNGTMTDTLYARL